jgi:hypothetical protein
VDERMSWKGDESRQEDEYSTLVGFHSAGPSGCYILCLESVLLDHSLQPIQREASFIVDYICIYFILVTVDISYFLPVLALPNLILFVPFVFKVGNHRTIGYRAFLVSVWLQAMGTRNLFIATEKLDVILGDVMESPGCDKLGRGRGVVW